MSFYGATRAEVVGKLDAARERLRVDAPARQERIALEAFLAHWLDAVVRPTLRPATYRQYESIVREHLAPSALGKLALRDLREPQIQQVLVARGKASARVRQLCVVVLRRALDQAVRYGFIAENPAAGIVPPRVAAKEVRTLSAAQVRAFLDAARGDRLFALYYLALSTGLRQGELLALRWSDVDLDGGTLRVVRSRDNRTGAIGPTKTATSRRRVALGPQAVCVLREHRARSSGPLLFTSAAGTALSPQNVRNRSFLPLQRAAGIAPPVRFHDLRHTAATLLLEAGVHPKVVSERLGHARVAFTMDTYQHAGAHLQTAAAAQIEQALGGIAGGTAVGSARPDGAAANGKPLQ